MVVPWRVVVVKVLSNKHHTDILCTSKGNGKLVVVHTLCVRQRSGATAEARGTRTPRLESDALPIAPWPRV